MAPAIPPQAAVLFWMVCIHLMMFYSVFSENSRTRWKGESMLDLFDSEWVLSEPRHSNSGVHRHGRTVNQLHRRHRRLVTNVEYPAPSVPETKTGLLLTVGSVVADSSQRRFRLESTSVGPNFIHVDYNTGNVYLSEGRRLDYENETMRVITMVIRATKMSDNTDTVIITATLPVLDVNDESPVFRNAPKPYLATVAATESAGHTVYDLYASDDDANAEIQYGLVTVVPEVYKERFEVVTLLAEDSDFGWIRKGYLRTKGSGRYPEDQEIKVDVSARDIKGDPTQLTVVTIRVLVGVRPPQFFEDPYRGVMYENSPTMQMVTREDGKELTIEVKKFQQGKVRFDLYNDASQKSSVFTINDAGKIFNLKVLDYESVDRFQQPLQFRLMLFVYEDLGTTTLANNATLIITVQDMNDNKPEFQSSQYLKTVRENLPIDSSVLEVKAEDLDSGLNAEIEYSVESKDFYLDTVKRGDYDYVGIIKVKRRLDYDRIAGHLYEVTVYASDKGVLPKSSSVNVRVTVLNVNDESPEFTSATSLISVDENAPVGTVITIVQALDQDGDAISYYFSPRDAEKENFRIDPSAGLISLARSVREGADLYVLNITAYDDGSCCIGPERQSSESYIMVQVVDVNTHKPTFSSCSAYSNAKVKEHSPVGEFIIQVEAEDADRGPNGEVKYEVVQPQDHTFRIGRENGRLTVGKSIDRESLSEKYIQVTVNGIDGAQPPLDGWCTFRVEVEDINDNIPQFDRPDYSAEITSDTQLNQVILAVRAYDADIGHNGEIEYSLVKDEGIFGIIPGNGFIFLEKSLIGQTSYKLIAMAKDKGTPSLNSTVTVTISVAVGTSNPPTWMKNYDAEIYEVNETASVGTRIASMQCQSNIQDDRVEFQIIQEDGSSGQSTGTFAISYSGNTMYLNVDGKLDYETVSSYTVRLRCLNFGPVTLQSEVNPTIRLIDKNDEHPYFQGTNRQGRYPGSVPENMDPKQDVITITGYDDDVTPIYSQLTFSLEKPSEDFEIVPALSRNTAVIRTKRRFDKETTSYYDLTVIAQDGAVSDRPGHMPPNTPNTARVIVEVFIKDQNDNAPYFPKPLYQVEVSEDQYIDTAFEYITADDPDETDKGRLNYLIIAGNAPLYKFGVKAATGGLFVAKTLDYESNDRLFELTLNASDGIHTASTRVQVTVLDANDNAPEFTESSYRIEGKLVEEDRSVLTNNKLLLTVTATDRDVDRPNEIRYSLQGFGTEPPNQFFRIDPETGDLFVIKPLDRDAPNGRSNYQFTVVAKDEKLQPWQFGYATVEVLPADINDNKPTFDTSRLQGSVLEHSPPGTSVMYVVATDPDFGNNGTVVYDIIQNPITVGTSREYFTIDRKTGLIKTNVPGDELDRETIPSLTLQVRASDEGSPPLNTTAVITVSLSDINDQKPMFDPVIYRTEMSENQKSGEVFRVGATDADIGNNAKLTYSLAEGDSKFFQVITIDNMGSILVYGEVDYEQASQQFFNLTVIAQDPNPDHTATAHIEIMVRDFNDNPPAVLPQVLPVEIDENKKSGFLVAVFNATDKDSGENAKFEFSIDRKTDPRRHFSIGPTSGQVTLRRPLDRETQERHVVFVKAIDKGDPPQTGTGTLTVTVKDINDNFPQFRENYQPQVREGEANIAAVVQVVLGKDLDAPPYGPPFGFSPCSDGSETCPCPGRPLCELFGLSFNPTGDGGNGTATITTKTLFDREKQKYYYIPIVMWDMRGTGSGNAMTGTNTLTVTIADINDNKPRPGHQEIFVYNYKGLFGPLDVGRVYVEDEDDWDLPNKTFIFAEPNWLKDYFVVNQSTGMVTMQKGVPSNTRETPYQFKVDVYDAVWEIKVRSTVSVSVQDLTEEAVANSGAIRIRGTTAEEFIIKTAGQKSKKEKFHELLSKLLGTPKSHVEIFTVMDVGEFTDVRYAAHGSPYYQSSQTDSMVDLNREQIEREVGIEILMVPIDACADEQFEDGCFNMLNITGRPAMVNTNGTSFVGVEAYVTAKAGCRALEFPDPNECTGSYCYHGGTCIKDDWGVLKCNCPPQFDGPRCQQRRHSFDGSSYALYPTLEQCEESQTTIEFITQQPDGLILYNGPTTEIDLLAQPEDYISLELIDGYPRLMINHGTGALTLSLDGQDSHGAVIMRRLNDGQWHRIDIIRSGRNVEMVVDYCRSVVTSQDVQSDTRPCRVIGRTPGENTFLNVNTLLQLGGRYFSPRYPQGIIDTFFNGCLRNLVHNGKLYDLYFKSTADFNSGLNGCQQEDAFCGQGDYGNHDRCGTHGMCTARWDLQDAACVCKPGWRGSKCNTPTTIRDLKTDSYLRWTIKTDFFSSHVTPDEMEIQLMFRTRDENGVLFTASSTDNTQTITLELNNGHVRVLYNLGDGEQSLELSTAPASNGQWHTVNARRHLQQMTLTMDGGEGRNYNFSRGDPTGKVNLVIQRLIFAGASVSYSQEVPVRTRDLSNTCVQDIRLNNGWFPMDYSENDSPDAVAELTENPNVVEGCIRSDCSVAPCPLGRVCYPLWEEYACRCEPGYHELELESFRGIIERICESDCKPNPCYNNGTCQIKNGQVVCNCLPGYTGQFCNIARPEESVLSSMTTPGIVAIIISIFVVLLLLLLVFLLLKFRRTDNDSDKYILEVDPEDDIRENVINYDEEGAGEEDQDAYDISRLQRSDDDPLKPNAKTPLLSQPRLRRSVPDDKPDVGDFINERMHDADDDPNAPPHDSVMEFAFEGGGSESGSLSSLNTSSSGASQDYDYLNEWGPKFSRLADMYGGGSEEGEED